MSPAPSSGGGGTPFDRRSGTMSPVMSRLLVLIVLLVVVVGASSCSDAGDVADDPPPPSPPPADLSLEVGSAVVVSDTQGQAELEDPARSEVLEVVTRFLERASMEPMITGSVGDDIEGLLTAEVAEQLAAGDRSAVVDEGLPPSGEVAVVRSAVDLSGLAAGTEVQLVVARFDLELAGDDGTSLHRRGELTVVPVDEGWRIAAYDLTVDRVVPDASADRSTTTETS